MKKNRKIKSKFTREKLPNPSVYFTEQGIRLIGSAEWRSALCPFHADKSPSLRIRVQSGSFRCMACGAHGGDILAFHMQLHNLSFIEAIQALGAVEGSE